MTGNHIRRTHACIVVQMDLNITSHDATESPHEVIYLSWVGTTDGIRDTYTIDTDLVDGLVDREEVDKVGAEGVLGREANFNVLGLDKVDDLDGSLSDVGHVLDVRKLAEEGGSADDDVDTVDTYDRKYY